ncbi:MAG: TIGR03016 family PEP-CTERM system-associated outer membrane protein [Methylotetracoccus sp.]
MATSAQAGDFDFRPSVSVSEFYSDNIRLAPSGQRNAAWVSNLIPGIDMRHDASRFNFDLRYRMQNLFYAGSDAPANRIQNYLQSNANAELIEDNIYFGAQANVGRLIASTGGSFAPSNVFSSKNTTDFTSVRVNPYWRGHIKGYTEGYVGVSYSNVGTGAATGTGTTTTTGTISGGNSNIVEEYANFQSGTDLEAVTWRANFANSEFSGTGGQTSSLASNSTYRSVNGEVRYHFLEDYAAFVRAGNFDNQLEGVNGGAGGVNNGAYWTIGGAWNPSTKTALQGGWGENNYLVAAEWQPSRRTSMQVTFRDSRVGGSYGGGAGTYGGGGYGGSSASQVYYPLQPRPNSRQMESASGRATGSRAVAGGSLVSEADVAAAEDEAIGGYETPTISPYNQLGGFNSGTTWNALFRHATQRSAWCGAYSEVAQPFQTGLIYQSTSCAPSLIGGVLTSLQPSGVNPITQGGVNPLIPSGGFSSQLGSFDISQPSLTNQIISRKRGEISFALNTGKSNVGLYGYQENRSYQPSTNAQDVLGVAAYWEWHFARRTSTLLRFQWQQINNKDNDPTQNSRNDFTWVAVALRRELTRNLEAQVGYQYLQQASNVAENRYSQNGVWASISLQY